MNQATVTDQQIKIAFVSTLISIIHNISILIIVQIQSIFTDTGDIGTMLLVSSCKLVVN